MQRQILGVMEEEQNYFIRLYDISVDDSADEEMLD
jgi:hypothetical protein